jgi:ATP-dependent DNA helicase RecQ
LQQAKDILKKYWGFDQFRSMQEDIIQSVMDGVDTLALLPTGGGKSICFQVPALMMDGMCLVVSPLIALMTDQVHQLKSRGISAATVLSGMPHREIDVLLDNCVFGKVKFLYVSPERLKSELFIARVRQMNIDLIAIDEAHCISQWGYDFRPAYLDIEAIYPFIGEVKKMALTATATAIVKKDIVEKLGFEDAQIFTKSFARKNLSYSVFEQENKGEKLLEILNNVRGSAIIYVRSRIETQNVAKFLYRNGISSDFYHAGLEPKVRLKKQTDWISNARRVMVSTNAFGMGIDKPDVRVVVHLDLPDSLEAYYQEAGRAGRDELKAFAVLLYNKGDVYSLRENIKNRNSDLEFVQRVYQGIANYLKLATGSSEWQSFDFDLKSFAHTYKLHVRNTHFAIQKLQEMGLMLLSESLKKSSSAKFVLTSNEVYKFMVSNAKFEPLIKGLLRLYGGVLYTDFTDISEFDLARLCNTSTGSVSNILRNLSQSGVLIYDPIKTQPQLTYLTPRLEVSTLKKHYNVLIPRQKVIEEKAGTIISYAEEVSICRTRIIQEYFDETTYVNCGVCDVCIKAKKEEKLLSSLDSAKEKLEKLVGMGFNEIINLKKESGITDDFLFTESIRVLIDEGVLKMEGYSKLTLRKSDG